MDPEGKRSDTPAQTTKQEGGSSKEGKVSFESAATLVEESVSSGKKGDIEWQERPFVGVGLLLIALLIGALVLSSSASLSILDSIITPQVHGMVAQRVFQETKEKWPHLSDGEIAGIVKSESDSALKSVEGERLISHSIESQKSFFRDEHNQTYLFEPDAYYYLRYARNVIDHGHMGETLRDGKPFDTLRQAPLGVYAEFNLLSYVEAKWFRLWRLVSPKVSLLRTSFFLPVMLGLVSIALIFCIALKIFSDMQTAFFSAVFFALHPYFFRQNMAGFTDTPSLVMPLSLLFFLCILQLLEGSARRRSLGAIGICISVVALRYTWNGWFFVLGVAAVFCMVLAIFAGVKHRSWKIGISFAALGAVGAAFLARLGAIDRVLTKLQFTRMDAAQMTVKELARPTFSQFIASAGGPLFGLILLFAIIWVVSRLARRKAAAKEVFLLVWFIVMLIPASRISRFMFFLIPPASLLVGWMVSKGSGWLSDLASDINVCSKKTAGVILLFLLPLSIGAAMVDISTMRLPPLSAATADTAQWFRTNTSSDAIINEWWDYGYVWEYSAQRSSLLDAGPSNRSIWAAKAFITDNETYARGLFRMLDCNGIHVYSPLKVKAGIKAAEVLETILKGSRSDAEKTFAEYGLDKLIKYTHCNPREGYVIVDQNTIEVLPSIGALVSWSQELSLIDERTRGMSEDEAIAYVEANALLSHDDAVQKYLDAKDQEIVKDGEISIAKKCAVIDDADLNCLGYTLSLADLSITPVNKAPYGIVLFKNGTRTERVFSGGNQRLSLIVYDEDDEYRAFLVSPKYADSLLVRLYAGETMESFKLVHRSLIPERIMTWKIEWPDE